MAATDWLTPAAITLIAGGAGTGLGVLVKARVDLRKTKLEEERQPVELESVFIGGAERAVSALSAALDRTETNITRLEKALSERDEKLQERDRRIADLEQDLATTRHRLSEMQTRCEQLQTRLADLRIEPREGEAL
ncbi:hypothetical protein [Nonomuraea sp. WAC 01424]|uniref:hypothetical protein n=1 Tax=Nonomuraea sp. WAC 01424 TaxID=2203200 RepID=UPI000F79FF60|nr:hypothetical protein [Nonomuraea sp. WAC 01424]